MGGGEGTGKGGGVVVKTESNDLYAGRTAPNNPASENTWGLGVGGGVWASVVNECGCPACQGPFGGLGAQAFFPRSGRYNKTAQRYRSPRADTSCTLSGEVADRFVLRAFSTERELLIPEPGKPVVAHFALEISFVIRSLGLRMRPRPAVVLRVRARAHARLLLAAGLRLWLRDVLFAFGFALWT